MSRPRVLIVDTERVWRGGQQQIFTLLEGLLGRVELRLACPGEAPLAERATRLGIPWDSFSQRAEISPLALFRLLHLIRKWRPDIIHFNTPRSILAGCLAARLVRPRPRCLASRRVVFPLASPLSRFKYSHLLDVTLTVSESIRQVLSAAGVPSSRLRTVYEGVESGTVPVRKENRSGPLRVAAVGHLSVEKGQEFLLRAGAILKADYPNLIISLFGDGAERPRLESLARNLEIREMIEFRGFCQDIPALLAEVDIFCLPSLSEGLSSALLEAMSAGLPIVATDVGGIPELVGPGENGFLVPAGDAQALAEALARLLLSPELRTVFGEASRQRILRHFSLASKIDRTLEAYQELLRGDTVR